MTNPPDSSRHENSRTRPGGLAGRYTRGTLEVFVSKHEGAWDSVMGCLTVIYVVLAFDEDATFSFVPYAVWALAGVFLIEFAARIYDSRNRLDYLKGHWLDLVTAVPVPGIPGLRLVRLLRLLRMFRLGATLRKRLVARGWDDTWILWPTMVGFWLVSAAALWFVEHDAPSATVTTFPDAMTAAFLTAATLGYGKHDLLVTQEGQIISAVIVFVALGLWGFASSSLTRMWLKGSAKEDRIDLEGIELQLQRIHVTLEQLSREILEREERLFPSIVEPPEAVPDYEYASVGNPIDMSIETGNEEEQN